ncbi:MAG: phosphotransferase [Acetobacter papayae]
MASSHADPLDDTLLNHMAHQAVARYPFCHQARVSLVTRSENATFLVESPSGRYALRIHRPGYHEQVDIESELAWLKALHEETDIPVPLALADCDGKHVLTLAVPGGGYRYAVLFHWLEGEMPTACLDPLAFRQLGKITAKFHQHSRNWGRPTSFRRIVWGHETMVGPEAHWGDWRDTPGLSATDAQFIAQAIEQVGRELSVYGREAERYGLIHSDLRLTNLILHPSGTRVIDFDDCGFGWFMHDLAAAISFEEHHPSAPAWVENWLEGYEQVVPLSAEDRAILPALFVQRRVQLTAWTGSHAQTDMVRSLGPDWLEHTVRLCRRYLDGKNWPIGCV